MGYDFIKDRSTHLTIRDEHVYRAVYRMAESEELSVGDKVVVHLSNNQFRLCIVVGTDPLEMSSLHSAKYVKEG